MKEPATGRVSFTEYRLPTTGAALEPNAHAGFESGGRLDQRVGRVDVEQRQRLQVEAERHARRRSHRRLPFLHAAGVGRVHFLDLDLRAVDAQPQVRLDDQRFYGDRQVPGEMRG